MRRFLSSLTWATSLVWLAGCSSLGFQAPAANERGLATMDDAVAATPSVRAAFREDGENVHRLSLDTAEGRLGETPRPARDRKMIYSAAYTVLVSMIDSAIANLMAEVDSVGGYLATRDNATLTVRIPAPRFQEFLEKVRGFGRVLDETMNARDVTAEHTDLTIRLENAEQSRKRLLALLEKATKMEDVLKIEESLRRLTTEIEQMKGQLKLLDNRIAFSTVTVQFRANAPQTKKRQRTNSRFPWINRIGIEQDLRRFQP